MRVQRLQILDPNGNEPKSGDGRPVLCTACDEIWPGVCFPYLRENDQVWTLAVCANCIKRFEVLQGLEEVG